MEIGCGAGFPSASETFATGGVGGSWVLWGIRGLGSCLLYLGSRERETERERERVSERERESDKKSTREYVRRVHTVLKA